MSTGALAFITGYGSSDDDSNVDEKPKLDDFRSNSKDHPDTGQADVPAEDLKPSNHQPIIEEKPIKMSRDWRNDHESEDDSDSSSSSSSSSEESSESESSESEASDNEDVQDTEQKPKQNQKKSKHEFSLSDLPPIEDLHITVPDYECILLGKVSSVVDTLVVVESMPNKPAVDVDSVLFLDKGQRTLGKVFDIFGPVALPYYSVRFNSPEHIKESGIEKGLEVFLAPRTPHTSFVFFDQLMKLKGTDASWKDDIETPDQYADFSDDEKERVAKNRKKTGKKKDPDVALGAPPRKERAYQPPRPNQRSQNAFYRQNRRYDPREFGPIRWNHPHQQYQNSFQSYAPPPPPPPPNPYANWFSNQPTIHPSAAQQGPYPNPFTTHLPTSDTQPPGT